MSLNEDGIKTTSQSASDVALKKSKYLIFHLNKDKFAFPLLQVKEIIGMVEIRPIPNVERYYRGLINLRGQIISVIDLSTKLGIGENEDPQIKPCIIILQVGSMTIGTIVDEIYEVQSFELDEIEREIDIKGSITRDLMTGIARQKDGSLTILLDVTKLQLPKATNA